MTSDQLSDNNQNLSNGKSVSSSDIPQLIYNQENHRIIISKLVELAPFSVFGLVGNPSGLTLRSLSYTNDPYEIKDIGLTFANSIIWGDGKAFTVTSHASYQPSITLPKSLSELLSYQNSEAQLFLKYGTKIIEKARADKPQLVKYSFTVDSLTLSGEIATWLPSDQLQAFVVSCEEILLIGSGYGITKEELFKILNQLVIVNAKANLIEQYQAELEQNLDLSARRQTP